MALVLIIRDAPSGLTDIRSSDTNTKFYKDGSTILSFSVETG